MQIDEQVADRRAVVVGKTRRPEMSGLAAGPAGGGKVLSRTDARHVVVLAESRQVLVQLFYTFLVSLDTFAHQALLKLYCRQHLYRDQQ